MSAQRNRETSMKLEHSLFTQPQHSPIARERMLKNESRPGADVQGTCQNHGQNFAFLIDFQMTRS